MGCQPALSCYFLTRMRGARKVLFSDDERGYRDFLRELVGKNQDVQISGIAVDAGASSESVVARELRAILDGCPICDGGFGGHTYLKLATAILDEDPDGLGRLAQLFQCIHEHRWDEILAFRQWSASQDAVVVFDFRCDKGRVGTVMVLSPADPALPDEPLQFTILSAEEGEKLLGAVGGEQWMHFRPALHLRH